MSSKLKCIFPIASTPLRKINCITVGSCITICGTYFMVIGTNKYLRHNTVDKKKDDGPSNQFITTTIPTLKSFVFLPITESNDPYSFGMSLPILGIYSYYSYFLPKWWWSDFIKEDITK